MELLSVRQAAEILGVDDSRVRRLLYEGQLEGQRVGGRWLVDGDSTRSRKDRRPRSGRRLSARNAWGLLAALGGHWPGGLSDPEKSRLLARLRSMASDELMPDARLRELLAARAEVRRYRVHSGVLPLILADPDVVRAGVSAAAQVGADYVAPDRAEVYVRPDKVGKLEAGYGMVRDRPRGNLLVRIPPAEAWRILVPSEAGSLHGHDAPAAVVAVDLLDAGEDRARAAAVKLLTPLLARCAQPRKADR